MALDNYYNILSVAQNASAEDVQKAISEKRREWTPRTGHPKLETRQLAEQTIKNIAEAESILLDPIKRQNYDQQLVLQVSSPEPVLDNTAQGRDWLQQARDYLAQGNNSPANYAAREATNQQIDNPEAWYIRGLTSEALGNTADAEFEFLEAIRLNPNDAESHASLGDLYKNNNMWQKAAHEYSLAHHLEPGNVYYLAFLGLAYDESDDTERGYEILKSAYERQPNDEMIRLFYASCLQSRAINGMSVFPDGGRDILSAAQLDWAKQHLFVIDELKVNDREFLHQLEEFRAGIAQSEEVKLRSSSCQEIILPWFGAMGVGIAVALLLVALGAANAAGPLAFVAIIVMSIVLVMRKRMPGWKWARKQASPFVRTTGLQ